MKVLDYYRHTVSALTEAEIPNAVYEASLIFEYVFSKSYADIIINYDSSLSDEESDRLNEVINLRISGKPLQYILGKWQFMGFDFEVGEGVLIPRGETEMLVEEILEHLEEIKNPVVYDLCSGSGCIGLSIKKLIPSARVFMVEISDDALYYLNKNRENLGLTRDTCVIKGDILKGYEAFSSLPAPDVIISNPPYVESGEIPYLQKEVGYEPRIALDGGDDGLIFYRVLSEKWLPHINRNGFIAVECGENQAERISKMFSPYCRDTDILYDYSEIQRFVIGTV